MEFKTSAALIVALLGSLVLADDPKSTLPVLYRVDQPTSNVVVFRGANVALAQAAGLLRYTGAGSGSASGSGSGSGSGSEAGSGSGNGNDGNGGNGGNGNGAGNNANYYVPAPPPTTTTPPPPPPTTTTPPPPPPTTTAAPVYAPPPPPVAVYAPAPAPVVYRPAPIVSYAPAPAPAYEAEPAGPANYNWEYAVNDDHYNDFGHKETRDGYQATGKYYVNLPDGRTQIVTYTADANGYTPVVEYSGVAQYPEGVKPTYNY